MVNSGLVQRLLRRVRLGKRSRRPARVDPTCVGKVTPEWNPIDSAPRDRIWIRVRGWDFGIQESRRHYAIARFEDDKWISDCGDELIHLTDWQALPHRPYIIDWP